MKLFENPKRLYFALLGLSVVVLSMIAPTLPTPAEVRHSTRCPTPAQREQADKLTWIKHTLYEGNVEHRIIHHPSSIDDCPACIEEGRGR